MRTNEKKVEKRTTHFKSTFSNRVRKTTERNQLLFTNDARFPLTMLAYNPWSFASCVVWDVFSETESPFLRTAYASLPWFFVQLEFYG